MKVVILAGGMGTRISEESHLKPKPMVLIGERPILWHIMKIYSHYSYNEFIVCLGYLGAVITEYFANYVLHNSDVTFDIGARQIGTIHDAHACEPWIVTCVQTGVHTQTGGRISRIRPYVGSEPFLLTYGDGVADIDVAELVEFHRSHGRLVTVTAVQPPGRFGSLELGADDRVVSFREKPLGDGNWINGGFFVCQPEVFDYLGQFPGSSDQCVFEELPLERLAADGQLAAYRHRGFWRAMDTLRDKRQLEALWNSSNTPWRIWGGDGQ